MRRLSGLLVFLVCLSACGPEPTPFPVNIPITQAAAPTGTPTPLTVPASVPADGMIRYALAANTAGLVADLALLEQTAHVETLTAPVNPTDLGRRFDLVAAFGDLPGGARSPIEQQIVLIVNPAVPPTNQAEVVNVLHQAIQPRVILLALNLPGTATELAAPAPLPALRVALANAGWPDGFDLKLVYQDAPGAAPISAALQAVGVMVHVERTADISAALESGAAQLALVARTSPADGDAWETQVGAANIIPLYTLPISYLAVEGLTITFTPAGWPLARR